MAMQIFHNNNKKMCCKYWRNLYFFFALRRKAKQIDGFAFYASRLRLSKTKWKAALQVVRLKGDSSVMVLYKKCQVNQFKLSYLSRIYHLVQ